MHPTPWISNTWAAVSICFLSLAGCMSGPRSGRIAKSEMDTDAARVLTFYERMQTLREMERDIASQPGNQQATAQQLTTLLQEEKNAMLRAQAVAVLGQIPNGAAETALNLAESDVDSDVRQRVCEVRGKQRTREGVRALSRILETDDDMDVRLAAARALRNYRDREAYAALVKGLNDKDPALQRLALESIKIASGEDLGSDIAAWEEYVATGSPPEIDRDGSSFFPEWPGLPKWAALPKLNR